MRTLGVVIVALLGCGGTTQSATPVANARPAEAAPAENSAAAYKVDMIQRDLAAIDRELEFVDKQIRSAQTVDHRANWKAERDRLLELRAMHQAELAQVQRRTAPKTDEQRAAEARAAAEQAVQEARAAQERVERLAADLEALDRKLSLAVDTVVDAQNDADRAAATAKLKALQKEQAELEARVQQVKADAERAERKKGVKVSPQCQENPLAAGCD